MWSPTFAVLRSGQQHAVIVNEDGDLHPEAGQYLMALSLSGKAVNTGKAYSRSIAKLLNWCADTGVDWRAISLVNLGRFRRWYEDTPTTWGKPPSPSTVSLGMAGVVGFLRFCAHEHLIGSWVAEQLVEPKLIGASIDREHPANNKLTRRVKVRVPEQPVKLIPDDKLTELLTMKMRPRTAFLIQLLWCTGMRIGEALSLWREDLHTLPNNEAAGCHIRGAHVHAARHGDHPTMFNKPRRPRVIPLDDLTVQAHDWWLDYRHQSTRRRDAGGVRPVDPLDSHFLFVNVQGTTVNQPVTYATVTEMFQKISRRLDFHLHAHMIRHARATHWVRAGVDLDVVRALLGHASITTTQRYLHASDADLRLAIDRRVVA